jgi:hypothetical protein
MSAYSCSNIVLVVRVVNMQQVLQDEEKNVEGDQVVTLDELVFAAVECESIRCVQSDTRWLSKPLWYKDLAACACDSHRALEAVRVYACVIALNPSIFPGRWSRSNSQTGIKESIPNVYIDTSVDQRYVNGSTMSFDKHLPLCAHLRHLFSLMTDLNMLAEYDVGSVSTPLHYAFRMHKHLCVHVIAEHCSDFTIACLKSADPGMFNSLYVKYILKGLPSQQQMMDRKACCTR